MLNRAPTVVFNVCNKKSVRFRPEPDIHKDKKDPA